jgi:predicted RNase H-like HicB family nuclease
MQIVFTVSTDETGGFVARWDDPVGGGITTQGENLAELQEMVRDAVDGYFAYRGAPETVRLHFVEDPVIA